MTSPGSDSSTLELELDDGSPRYLTATISCLAPEYTSQLILSNSGTLPLGFKVSTQSMQPLASRPFRSHVRRSDVAPPVAGDDQRAASVERPS